jgi:hypothetical protein
VAPQLTVAYFAPGSRASASRELAEKEEELAKEAEKLKAQLAAESAARAQRDQKNARLQSEHDLLSKKAGQTTKASAGRPRPPHSTHQILSIANIPHNTHTHSATG